MWFVVIEKFLQLNFLKQFRDKMSPSSEELIELDIIPNKVDPLLFLPIDARNEELIEAGKKLNSSFPEYVESVREIDAKKLLAECKQVEQKFLQDPKSAYNDLEELICANYYVDKIAHIVSIFELLDVVHNPSLFPTFQDFEKMLQQAKKENNNNKKWFAAVMLCFLANKECDIEKIYKYTNLLNIYSCNIDEEKEAVAIFEKDYGVSDDTPMGSPYIWQCVVLIARDPSTGRTLLMHVNIQITSEMIKQAITTEFPNAKKLEFFQIGGCYDVKVASINVNNILNAIKGMKNAELKFFDVLKDYNKTPKSIVVYPKTGKIVCKVATKAQPFDGERFFRAMLQDAEMLKAFENDKFFDLHTFYLKNAAEIIDLMLVHACVTNFYNSFKHYSTNVEKIYMVIKIAGIVVDNFIKENCEKSTIDITDIAKVLTKNVPFNQKPFFDFIKTHKELRSLLVSKNQ